MMSTNCSTRDMKCFAARTLGFPHRPTGPTESHCVPLILSNGNEMQPQTAAWPGKLEENRRGNEPHHSAVGGKIFTALAGFAATLRYH